MDTDGYYLLLYYHVPTAQQTTDKLVLFIFLQKVLFECVWVCNVIYTSEVQPSRLHYTDELIQI